MSKISFNPANLYLNLTIFLIMLLFGFAGCAHTGKTSDAALENSEFNVTNVTQDKDETVKSQGLQQNETDGEEIMDDELFLLEDEEGAVSTIKDPLYKWNRAVFAFNDRFYFYVARPVTKGYAWLVHEDVRTIIDNFLLNISMPIRFVNSFLQSKFKAAGTELLRFGINSTLGVAGFLDVAKTDYGLESSDEDFGQTLGKYKFGHGAYFILPFLGPSSIRDSVGLFGDIFLYPIGYLKPPELSLGLYTYEKMNRYSFYIDDYAIFKESSIDPYTAVRDAYYQNRRAKVNE